jgi:GntR family transcriptional regulator, transcriptional repressor for pyruvate dehydrogenase complex
MLVGPDHKSQFSTTGLCCQYLSRIGLPATHNDPSKMKVKVKESRTRNAENQKISEGSNRVSHRIVRRLQEMIIKGELKADSFLSSERELAAQFLVSRSSVREALSILETLGFVSCEPGKRARVLGAAGKKDSLVVRWRYASRFNEKDVYELRFLLDASAAKLAAAKATAEMLGELSACLTRMKDAVRQKDLLAAALEDFRFHDIIVAFSGNRLFKEIHDMNRDAILESQKLPFSHHDRLWEPIQEHEQILRALEQRDPDGASYLMQLHIIRAAERLGIQLRT